MKCPLFHEYWVESQDRHIEDYEVNRECWEGECAWWDSAYQMCIVRSIARLLDGILADEIRLRDKEKANANRKRLQGGG